MKVRHRKGLANHPGPESCGGVREGVVEALTGGERRPAIEPRNQAVWGADAVKRSGRPHRTGRYTRALDEPHAVEDPEHAQKLSEQEL